MQVTMTGLKPPSALGPSKSRCPTAMAPPTTVPATTDPTPRTSNVWSICGVEADRQCRARVFYEGMALCSEAYCVNSEVKSQVCKPSQSKVHGAKNCRDHMT